MSPNPPGPPPDARTDSPMTRYGEFHLKGGDVVVYDRENHRAWIQSSLLLTVEA